MTSDRQGFTGNSILHTRRATVGGHSYVQLLLVFDSGGEIVELVSEEIYNALVKRAEDEAVAALRRAIRSSWDGGASAYH